MNFSAETTHLGVMRPDLIKRLLLGDPGAAKELTLHNGARYVVHHADQWTVSDVLTIIVHGENVHVGFLSVATIRILR